jgi:outer membrane protein assembly factor BamD
MGDYKAANVALKTFGRFPSTKLRPKIYDYIMKSRYELAVNLFMILKMSVLKVHLLIQTGRKRNPNTEYSKTALDLRAKLEKKRKILLSLRKNRSKNCSFNRKTKKGS